MVTDHTHEWLLIGTVSAGPNIKSEVEWCIKCGALKLIFNQIGRILYPSSAPVSPNGQKG
jgi:hypothetical protein